MITTLISVSNENLEKVSRQFAHLMSRANATDSANEAENCVAIAQRLLWKYNVEESQLLSIDELDKKVKKEYIKDSVRVGKYTNMFNGNFNSRDWKADLLNTIAKNFFCKLRPSGWDEYDVIVGEPQNVQMVKDMFAYLEKQIRAARKLAFKSAVNDLPRAKNKHYSYTTGWYSEKPSQFAVLSWKESFARGAVASISKRLEATQKENIEATDAENQNNYSVDPNTPAIGYGAALVVQIYNDLDEAYYTYFPEEHPEKIKLREYQRMIEYNQRMAQLEKERQEREARVEAGLEPPPVQPKPGKVYKRRGRKPLYRSTEHYGAYRQGTAAGNTIKINESLKAPQERLK